MPPAEWLVTDGGGRNCIPELTSEPFGCSEGFGFCWEPAGNRKRTHLPVNDSFAVEEEEAKGYFSGIEPAVQEWEKTMGKANNKRCKVRTKSIATQLCRAKCTGHTAQSTKRPRGHPQFRKPPEQHWGGGGEKSSFHSVFQPRVGA